MSSIQHPNVICLKDFKNDGQKIKKDGTSIDISYAVLELAQGGTLFDYVYYTGGFSEAECRYFFRQMIDGLEACHNEGVTHRDLKPENILLDENFNIKIADFGWASAMYKY